MPNLENGVFDRNGHAIKTPITPPQEPTRNGLYPSHIVEKLENSILPERLSGTINGQDVNTEGSKQQDNIARIPESRKSSSHHLAPVPPNGEVSEHSSCHASFGGSQLKLRRTSSDQSTSRREKRSSREYDGDKVREFARSPASSSFAILSPTASDKSADGEHTFHNVLKPLFPLEEGTVLGPITFPVSNGSRRISQERPSEVKRPRNLTIDVTCDRSVAESTGSASTSRPRIPRALSTPGSIKSPTASVTQEGRKARTNSRSDPSKPRNTSVPRHQLPSPVPASIPLPPLSLPTYLQLELSSSRPSQMYIHRTSTSDFPYESSRVKIERLLNFLLLPLELEGVLWFGVLACLDSWLYTFTILPLRMAKSIYILCQSWIRNLVVEARFIASFVYTGSQRVWHRRRTRGTSAAGAISRTTSETSIPQSATGRTRNRSSKHHRRSKSVPSSLMPDDKADFLKGLLIITTCLILLRLDASRMYHWVRGQAAIKLYVIYNLLEVCDRLLSAIGQDVLECLFSQEALERKPDGHSKVLRPAWLFLLALAYCVVHATALFYQVVTLNVAVNSYSNALITLLMSNQFVEIKGTVFKKFEKESLFQVTCADVVERFQLWHMLMIIASRNIVETGAFNIGIPNLLSPSPATPTASSSPNITRAAIPPLTAASILPRSFTIVPSLLSSVSSYVPTVAHVLGPFVIVLGSEMLIDWLKHAYIGKFNNVRPVIYRRFLDILTKDYYTNAFGDQNLTKRLGLPVIPLSCLMIRAGFQTYQMIVAAWVPPPSANDTASLASIHQVYSTTRPLPTSTTALLVRRMDDILSSLPAVISNSQVTSYFTTTLVLLLMFFVLLVTKLLLGMSLLAFSRARYRDMKTREHTGNPSYHVDGGRRVGGWGVVEVDDDKRRVIYEDDQAALNVLKAKEGKEKAKKDGEREKAYEMAGLEKVRRYEMAAKRIW